MTIILPATAILQALHDTHVHYLLDFFSPVTWLVILTATFYTLIKYDLACYFYSRLETAKGRKTALTVAWTLIVLTAFVIPLLVRCLLISNVSDPNSLHYLYWQMVLAAFAFYIFISIRKNVFTNGWLGRDVGKTALLLSVVVSVIFIAFNIDPLIFFRLDRPALALPALLSGLIFYTFTFTLLIRASQWKKINFVIFIFIIGLALSIFNPGNYHGVGTIELNTPGKSPSPELKDYFREWVVARKAEIEQDSIFPVFLVNTYGGGIRASAFTNMALTYLDSIFAKNSKYRKSFGYYTFSISGASGGTVGAALQCAYSKNNGDTGNAYTLNDFYNFYQHDFLTAVLVPDLGRDVWAAASSIDNWGDRSGVQEELWRKQAERYLKLELGSDFNSTWKNEQGKPVYTIPLLFSNTLNVDDGLKGICAPVHLLPQDFPASIFIRDIIDSMNAHRTASIGISLITGAFLSARFPFLSPSGKMGPGFHFMDGGGKDNSGASTSNQIFTALGRYCEQAVKNGNDTVFTNRLSHLRFYFVSLNNSPYKNEPRKLVNNRFELISPVVGIVNSGIDGNAHAADSSLFYTYRAANSLEHFGFLTDYISVYPIDACDSTNSNYKAILPLGWQISDAALNRLRLSLSGSNDTGSNASGLKKIIELMEKEKRDFK